MLVFVLCGSYISIQRKLVGTSTFGEQLTYCHCSTSSNSHTVLLSKPASYSPALFSVPVKICEHAYQSFIVVYGMKKVGQLCGYSTLAGAVKVRLRYGGSTWKVRRTYVR